MCAQDPVSWWPSILPRWQATLTTTASKLQRTRKCKRGLGLLFRTCLFTVHLDIHQNSGGGAIKPSIHQAMALRSSQLALLFFRAVVCHCIASISLVHLHFLLPSHSHIFLARVLLYRSNVCLFVVGIVTSVILIHSNEHTHPLLTGRNRSRSFCGDVTAPETLKYPVIPWLLSFLDLPIVGLIKSHMQPLVCSFNYRFR